MGLRSGGAPADAAPPAAFCNLRCGQGRSRRPLHRGLFVPSRSRTGGFKNCIFSTLVLVRLFLIFPSRGLCPRIENELHNWSGGVPWGGALDMLPQTGRTIPYEHAMTALLEGWDYKQNVHQRRPWREIPLKAYAIAPLGRQRYCEKGA